MAILFAYLDGAHFIGSLQLADLQLRQRSKDEGNIRWIVSALHDALYHLLISKLTRTDSFGIFNDQFEKEVGEFYSAGLSSNSQDFHDLCEKSLKESIAGLGKLLSRASLKSGATIKVKNLAELSSPSRGLSRLKEMRDFFSHPKPILAGYEEDYIVEAVEDTIMTLKEVFSLPDHRTPRYDPHEASILLSSIEYYFAVWKARMEGEISPSQ